MMMMMMMKLEQRRRREISSPRNEIVLGGGGGQFSLQPGLDEMSAVTVSAHPDTDQQALVSSYCGRSSYDEPPPNFLSDIIEHAFTNIRETDIVDDDDEASVSQSTSRNDVRDVDFRSDAAPPSGDDETRRRLLRNFLDAKETDIVGDSAGDVALLTEPSQRSCARTGSKKNAEVHCGPGAANDTEAVVPASDRIKRQKTIGACREGEKAAKRSSSSSSQVQKSKSFSQADSAASRDRVRGIYKRNRRSVRQRKISSQTAGDCSGASGIRMTSADCANAGRMSTKAAAKSAAPRKNGRTTLKCESEEDTADVQRRAAEALAVPEVDRKRKALVRSHSTRQAKSASAEQQERKTLRRNVTVTATDAGVGGLAATASAAAATGGVGNLLRRVRRQRADATPILKLKCPATPVMTTARLTRQGSVDFGGSQFGGSQESFFTAHGDSVEQLDLETGAVRGFVSRRCASDNDDNDADYLLTSYSNHARLYNSLISRSNSYRWGEKSITGAPPASTLYGSAGPILFRVDDDDHPAEDGVVVGHVAAAEAKVSVPISVCFIIIATYIIAGSAMFASFEDWDYLTGSYFCFITLSTIGFGDVVPGTDMDQWSSHEKLVLCVLWLAFGLSLIAMCFNLMQEEVKEKCRWLGRKLGLLKAEK